MTTIMPIDEIIEKIHSLPTLPSVVMVLNQRLSSDHTSSGDVAEIIERDHALASQVLRLANSSFFGLRSKVSSIRQAVSLMGFSTIGNLALATSVLQHFSSVGDTAFKPKLFWQHSIAVAAASKRLAEIFRLEQRDEAFTAGLLHDIGVMIFLCWMKEDFTRMLKLQEENGISVLEAERKVFSLTHTEVGMHLGEHWHFPKSLVDSIRWHHEPNRSKEYSDLVSTIHLADILINGLDLGCDGSHYFMPLAPEIWRKFELTTDRLDQIIPAILDDAVKANALFHSFV